jgi:DNA replication protein DnaC
MERIDGLLPDVGKITTGSSASRKNSDLVIRLDDKICAHCGRELSAEFFEFPPGLQRKYQRSGEWYYHPCTPECEKKDEQREWELARRDARIASLREKSHLPKRLKRYTFDNFDPYASESATRALQKAMAYCHDDWEENQEEGRGLYFCGDVGAGKTHLAVAVMQEIIRRRRVPSLFVTVPELLDNLRGAYNDPGRDIDEWMEAVKNAELLVLDDLGSEKATVWVQERLFVIVNHRYREALPTIFTSNIGPEDLPSQLGRRTASRIIAMCEGVRLEGADHRETARSKGQRREP